MSKHQSASPYYSAALVRALLQATSEWVFLLDDSRQIEALSVGVESALSQTGDEIRGRSWSSLCASPDEVEAILNEAEGKSDPVYFHASLLDKQGAALEAVFSCLALSENSSQRYYLITGYRLQEERQETSLDTASQLARRVAELQESLSSVNRRMGETAVQLAEEQQKMNAVMASLGEGMLVLDTRHQIIQVGGRAEVLLHRSKEEILGQKLAAVLPELFRSLGSAMINRDEAGTLQELMRDIRFPYQEHVFRANLAPIVDSEHQHLGSVVIFEDFTRNAEIDRMKSELISIVSHELRAPLSSILGYVELLLDPDGTESASSRMEHLEIVRKNARRLVEMVDIMLDVDSIESGKLQLQREQIDVAYLCHYVVSLFRQAAKDRDVELTVEIGEGLSFVGDLGRMIQVLSNLFSNAIKYTPPGGNAALRAWKENEQILIEISDTGMGISAEDQKRLFDKFFRASNATGIKGTGLGLSIALGLVQAHGGTITVSSQPGHGSRFLVSLPG